MKSRTFPILRAGAVILSVSVLAACNNARPDPEPEPTIAPEPEPLDTGEQASIIRPDIEIARTQTLEPVELTVGFGNDGLELTAETVTELANLVESPQITELDGAIVLRGHSDAAGNDAVNLRASQERADIIAQWLIENGVDEDRITTIAFGEQNPVAPNALPDGTPNEAGRRQNRRVDIFVAVPEGATIPTPAEPQPQTGTLPGSATGTPPAS